MAALSAARFTKDLVTYGEKSYPQKASTVIYPGAMVAINGGYAAPATLATGLKIKGNFQRDFASDNSSGGNGAKTVTISLSRGPTGPRYFKYDNDPGAGALAATDVGSTVYALDDHTVSKTSTGASAAGEMIALDADGGIWVDHG
jgi:hypothetical protein